MAVPGLYLATLGGSLYYAIAGLLILISAWLVLRRRPFGDCAVLAGVRWEPLVWSLWEVGLDGWALMPRLVYLAVAACGCCCWISRRMRRAARACAFGRLLLLVRRGRGRC